MSQLVGDYATGSADAARTHQYYTVAYEYLYQALAPSDDDSYFESLDEDEMDDDEALYVGTNELLTILVEKLHLPKTLAYQKRKAEAATS